MEYTYIVRNRSHLVGTERRFPGDLIPEAAEWPNVRTYVDNNWIERIPVDDPEVQAILESQPSKGGPPESSQPNGATITVKTDAPVELVGMESLLGAVGKEGERRLAQRSAAAQQRR